MVVKSGGNVSTRERRSLWGSISRSKKVNALSDRATILYILTIPHLDDEGFIDADPGILKSECIPLRKNIQEKDIPSLTEEICNVHRYVKSCQTPLWILHKTTEGIFIQDPYFNDHQSFKAIRKKPSRIKHVVDRETKGCQLGVDEETNGCLREGEGKGEGEGEVKRSEVATENKRVVAPTLAPEKLQELFNSVVKNLPKVSELGKGRREKIKNRIKEGKTDMAWWETVFKKADIILIPGRDGRKDWFPNFDWLIENDRNATKVFEGNYGDARRPQALFNPQPGIAAFIAEERRRKEDGI